MIYGSARETANERTVWEKANAIALTDEDVAHKGADDISLRRILTDLHTKGRREGE